MIFIEDLGYEIQIPTFNVLYESSNTLYSPIVRENVDLDTFFSVMPDNPTGVEKKDRVIPNHELVVEFQRSPPRIISLEPKIEDCSGHKCEFENVYNDAEFKIVVYFEEKIKTNEIIFNLVKQLKEVIKDLKKDILDSLEYENINTYLQKTLKSGRKSLEAFPWVYKKAMIY